MTNKLKVNQNRSMSINLISNILNTQILLNIGCDFKGNGFTLRVETTETVTEYFETTKKGMIGFLKDLKEKLTVKDDINNLIESI